MGRTDFIPNGPGRLAGVTLDSRQVQAGDLYAALPGEHTHGAAYCDQAVAAGAIAILTDQAGRDRAARTGVPVFVVSAPRDRLGDISCWIYGDPSHRMTMIGVTGTSGKTTTSYLAEAGLRAAGHETGLVGGVEIRIGAERVGSALTTPEAPDLQALLAVMVERRVTAAAMEVSSHSLALGRVDGTRYDVAVFTNLSQDHLDFHAGFEDYFKAKAQLFTPRYAGIAVLNVADRYGRRLVAEASVPVVTFCADPASGAYRNADWRAADVRCGADGSTFRVIGPGGVEADASVTLPGAFNVANALGAIVALVEAGCPLEDAVAGVAPAVPACPAGWSGSPAVQPDVFVDYSHKPGAVEAVLGALRSVTAGDLIVVLGCGGDRDRGKRPLMGAAAARLADVAILTSDNPRSEDPLAILDEMLHGVLGVHEGARARVIVEPDRAAAIGLAVGLAGKGDVVLVAGKGHETGQYVAGTVLPFDDRAVTAAALARRDALGRRRGGPVMIPLTLAEIAALTGGSLAPAEAAARTVTGPVIIDSRRVTDGALFAALPGERADGHDYAPAAVAAGAAGVLASRPVPGAPAVVVPDVTVALGALAKGVLGRLPAATVTGITGSSGKTSTKDLAAQVVEHLGPTIAPEDSFNNEIGLPLTVLRAGAATRFLVLEMSARGIGHIAALCDIAPPRIGAVLNVGRAHAGEFGSLDAVAKAKGELPEALPADGVAVLNADDPRVLAMAARTAARVVTFGVRDTAIPRHGGSSPPTPRCEPGTSPRRPGPRLVPAADARRQRGRRAAVARRPSRVQRAGRRRHRGRTRHGHPGHRRRAERGDRAEQAADGGARAARRGTGGKRRLQRQP